MDSKAKKSVLGGIATTIIIIVIMAASTTNRFDGTHPSPQSNTNQTKLRVIASFFPMYEFARNIGGDKADVQVFIPVGDEPHGWEPPTKQILEVQKARLFIYNGYGVESFIPSFTSGNFPDTTFVKASQGINVTDADVQKMATTEANMVIAQGGKDPHVWNDPILAEKEVRNISKAMESEDPTNAQYYEKNTASYIAKLSKLDQDISTGLAHCKTRTFVSFHNAFNYFAHRYNLTNVWISGLAPEAEAPPQDLARVENMIKENNVKIVFAEDLVNPKLAESLASDVGVQVKILSPLEGVNKTEEREGTTFIDKWYQNLGNLREAMGCQ